MTDKTYYPQKFNEFEEKTTEYKQTEDPGVLTIVKNNNKNNADSHLSKMTV